MSKIDSKMVDMRALLATCMKTEDPTDRLDGRLGPTTTVRYYREGRLIATAKRHLVPPGSEAEEMCRDVDGFVEAGCTLRFNGDVATKYEEEDAWYLMSEFEWPKGHCAECGTKDGGSNHRTCIACNAYANAEAAAAENKAWSRYA
jgi:hypothetical protein